MEEPRGLNQNEKLSIQLMDMNLDKGNIVMEQGDWHPEPDVMLVQAVNQWLRNTRGDWPGLCGIYYWKTWRSKSLYEKYKRLHQWNESEKK